MQTPSFFLVTINPDHTFLRRLSKVRSRDAVFLEKVIQVIQDNIGNKKFKVADLARHVHLSQAQLNRNLKRLVKCPAARLIRQLRLQYAAYYLMHDGASVGEIAHEIGFSDSAHFCRSFKKLYSLTPSQFKTLSRSHQLSLLEPHAQKWQQDAQKAQ